MKISKIFITFLIVPIYKIFGFGNVAMAAACSVVGGCTPGDISYESCGTNKMQKRICKSCTAEICGTSTICDGSHCQDMSFCGTIPGVFWAPSGDCSGNYTNECTAGGAEHRACNDEIGTGQQSRYCTQNGGFMHWGNWGTCKYTSCKNPNDVLDNSACYCTDPCSFGPGASGRMAVQLRRSSVCPIFSSSSSSSSG